MTGRAVILSVRNSLLNRTGAGEYLSGFAGMLADQGMEVSILFLDPPPPPMLRQRLIAEYATPFAAYRMRGTLRLGGHVYLRDPRRWLARAAQAARLVPRPARPVRDFGLEFAPPSPAALDWAARQLRALAPDMVIANYFNSVPALEAAPPGVPRAVLVHDVLALRKLSFEAAGAAPDFDVGLIADEQAAFAAVDLALAIKPEEAAQIAAHLPRDSATRVVLCPVPRPVAARPADPGAPRPDTCIFVGGDNPPNSTGLAWFLEQVWPALRAARPGIGLRVVGAVCRHLADPLPPGVVRVGFAQDLAAEYAAAALAIVPLRLGSGVKIKLIEALAAGLPAVASPVGAEGLAPLGDAPAGVLRVADGPQDFAAAVLATLDAPDPAVLREGARAYVRRHYDPATLGPRLAAALRDPAGLDPA